jgi:WD40 repeat protein
VNALKPIHVVTGTPQLQCARFSPDGAVLAAGGIAGVVQRWKLADKKLEPLKPLEGHHGWVGALAFHPKEPWLITGDSWGRLRCQTFAEEETKVIWEIPAAHEAWLRQLDVSPDGSQIATCGKDEFVRVWTSQGKPVAEYKHDDDVFVVTFTPDGKEVLFGDQHGHLLQWDFAAKKITRKIDAPSMYKMDRMQDLCGLRVLTFSRDGKLLLVAGCTPNSGATTQSVPTCHAFDFATGKLKNTFNYGTPKDGALEDIVVHPDGYVIAASSGNPGTGRVLRFKPEEKAAFDDTITLANCQAVTLHPDGQHFVVVSTIGTSGNGKPKTADGSYPSNTCPVNLFFLPEAPKNADKGASLDANVDAKVPK